MPFIKKKKETIEVQIPKEDEAQQQKKLGLTEQVAELSEKLDLIAGIKKTPEKKFKLPGFKDKKLKKLNKGKNRAIFMLRRNGAVELLKGEYMQGMVKIGENYYDASAMFVWMFKKMNKYTPFYIIPEWSIRPLCREEIYNQAKNENTLIDSQVITLRAMKLEQVGATNGVKMGGMLWIGIAIAAIIIGFLFFGGGK